MPRYYCRHAFIASSTLTLYQVASPGPRRRRLEHDPVAPGRGPLLVVLGRRGTAHGPRPTTTHDDPFNATQPVPRSPCHARAMSTPFRCHSFAPNVRPPPKQKEQTTLHLFRHKQHDGRPRKTFTQNLQLEIRFYKQKKNTKKHWTQQKEGEQNQ